MHTIFMRAHNTFEKYLHYVNPHWSGEQLYLVRNTYSTTLIVITVPTCKCMLQKMYDVMNCKQFTITAVNGEDLDKT